MKAIEILIYKNRRYLKSLLATANRILPSSLSRRLRAFAEQVAFRVVPEYQGDTLPPIFHYWAHRHVLPLAESVGITSAEQMYLVEARKIAKAKGQVSIASIGSGAGWLELSILGELRKEGLNARMHCVDFNADLMRKAAHEAQEKGLADSFSASTFDCNKPFVLDRIDIIIVNQFFHHVEDLRTFAISLRNSLAPDGLLLTSDIVGRNGHSLWPSVDAVVQDFWKRLPQNKRLDRYYSAPRDRYVSVNHAAYSNEGVCAQDVVTSLLAEFDFDLFLTFGSAIIPFVERRIGFNFDPESPEDAAFIDGLAAIDRSRIESGDYPASNMIAILRHKGKAETRVFLPVSPEQHVAATRHQVMLCQQTSEQLSCPS